MFQRPPEKKPRAALPSSRQYTGSAGHFHAWRQTTKSYPTKWDAHLCTLLEPTPLAPVLAWGHALVSEQAIAALHYHGCHVLETWPGDSLTPGEGRGEHLKGGAAGNGATIRNLVESTQHARVDGRPVVLLISNVDRICPTGRAMLKTLYAEVAAARKAGAKSKTAAKSSKREASPDPLEGDGYASRVVRKRKRGAPGPSRPKDLAADVEWVPVKPPKPPATLRIVCTCSDYYAPSMKTVMHGLVPKAKTLKLEGLGKPRTPWEALNVVRSRPANLPTYQPSQGALASGLPQGLPQLTPQGVINAAKQEDADQLLREDSTILPTLHKNAYHLQCLAERVPSSHRDVAALPAPEATLDEMDRAVNVADHFSTCDLLAPLTVSKRKLHEDDDDEEQPMGRPGNDPHIAALGMGLALKHQVKLDYMERVYTFGPRQKRTEANLDEFSALLPSPGPLYPVEVFKNHWGVRSIETMPG